jgi:Flp pilus assembly protein TadD
MSDAQASLECPACGSRNKPTWEFCARCGESLAGAEPDFESPAEAASEDVPAAPVESSSWWPFLLASAVAVAALIGVWRSGWMSTDPARPDPNAFQLPKADATPPPLPYPKGATKFNEARGRLIQGDMAGALKLFEEALEIEPDNAEFRSVYAQALLKAGRGDDALSQMREAARLSPSTHHVFLARYLFVAGRPADALLEYQSVLTQNPDDHVAAREYATLLGEAGQYAKAASVLRGVAAASPDDMNIQASLAYALEQSGDRTAAVGVYRSLLDKNAGHVGVRIRLADLLFAQGDAPQAVQTYRAGLTTSPNDPSLHRGLGEILERTGDLKGAAAEYREFVRLDPNTPQAKRLAARAEALERRAENQSEQAS